MALIWEPDSETVRRHFVHLGIRGALLLGASAVTIPVVVGFVSSQISAYKNAIVQAAQSDVCQRPPLDQHSVKVLSCVDVPPAQFGEEVLKQFGGTGGMRRAMFSLVVNYVRDELVNHALRLATLHGLTLLSTTKNPIGRALSLEGTPFPSYIAAFDFANSSQVVWSGRILFLVPNVVLKYSLPLACTANPAIRDEQLKAVSSACTPASLAKWQLALNAPFLAITLSRLVRHYFNAKVRKVSAPLPPSSMPAGKGKLQQAFRARGYLNAVVFDVLLLSANVGTVYAFAYAGPRLFRLSLIFDPARGDSYAWSSISETLLNF